MIRVGAYKIGNNDQAIKLYPHIKPFSNQSFDHKNGLELAYSKIASAMELNVENDKQ